MVQRAAPKPRRALALQAGWGVAGHHEKRSEAEHIFSQIDLDGDGKISFAEFVLHRKRQHWVRERAGRSLSTAGEGNAAPRPARPLATGSALKRPSARPLAVQVPSSQTTCDVIVVSESGIEGG